MNQYCLPTIRSIYYKLSEKEKKIADYILEKPETVIHQTINEVADQLNLADATVFRFSKRIGFKGFQAMKIALASEIIHSGVNDVNINRKKEHDNRPAKFVFSTTIDSLQKTYDQLDNISFLKAVKIILTANKVQFFGTGTSSILALDSFYKFSQAGINASAYMETQIQLITAKQLTKNDVAVLISLPENHHETLPLLEIIRETGSTVITVTGSSQSKVNSHSDIPFYAYTDGTDELGSLSLRSGQQAILDALYINTVQLMNKGR